MRSFLDVVKRYDIRRRCISTLLYLIREELAKLRSSLDQHTFSGTGPAVAQPSTGASKNIDSFVENALSNDQGRETLVKLH